MNKKILTKALIALGILSSSAQTWNEYGSAPINTTKIKMGENGFMYYLTSASSDNVYYSTLADVTKTKKLPGQGTLIEIAVSPNRILGIGGNGTQIYELNVNNAWQLDNSGTLNALDCSDENIVGFNSNSSVYKKSLAGGNWTLMNTTGTVNKIDIGNDESIVIANNTTSYIYTTTSNSWVAINNTQNFSNISNSNINNIWAVNLSGVPYKYNPANNSWEEKNGTAIKYITTRGVDEVWYLGTNGKMYCNNTIVNPSNTYASYNNKAPLNSKQIETNLAGDILILNNNVSNNVYKQTRTDSTLALLPGSGTANDIAAYNGIFAIGTTANSNNIYKWANNTWSVNHVAGTLIDLDINNSTLIGVNSAGSLYALTITSTSSTWLGLTLPSGASQITKVSITEEGIIFAIDNQNRTYKYQNNSWSSISSNFQNFTSITSLDINNVWAIANGDLYKYNLSSNSWNQQFSANHYFKSIAVYSATEIWALGNFEDKVYKINLAVTDIEKNNQTGIMSYYPNPVKDVLNISTKGELYNLNGVKITEGEGKIDMTDLPKGIYLLKTYDTIQKIIKD